MKKVKFFSGPDKTTKELEEQINEFCASHRVMDIQYQSFPVYTPGRDNKTIRSIDAYSRVMVVYKIKDERERECNNCAFSGLAPWSYPCNRCVGGDHWEEGIKGGSKEDEKNEQAE